MFWSPRKFRFGRSNERGGTVVVAPHSDDAAFSLGGILYEKALPLPITLITLCTVSDHMDDSGGWSENIVTSLRTAEERRFAFVLGLNLQLLSLEDTAIRHGDQIRDPTCSAYLPGHVVRRLEYEIRLLRPKLTLLPMAIGDHRDHIATRNSLRHLRSVAFYEDLPYASGVSELEFSARGSEFELAPITFQFAPGTLAKKVFGARIYRSQFNKKISNSIRERASSLCRFGGERLWFPQEGRQIWASFLK